jgi:hypothetical protein
MLSCHNEDRDNTVLAKEISGRDKFVGFYDKHSRRLRIDCPTDPSFWLDVDCGTILGLHQIEPKQGTETGANIRLTITFLSDKSQVLYTNKYATVLALKKQLRDIKGMHPDQQKIIFEGTELRDDLELNYYGIPDSSILHCTNRFCGV